MGLFDLAHKTIHLKVVYYGCALSGKTTNLITLHRLTDPDGKQGLVSIATKQDRTLFFDLLPLNMGQIAGLNVRVKTYTVPGQVHYELTRRQVLSGADAVVLVIDSAPDMRDANGWTIDNLRHNLKHTGLDPDATPIVLQWNKRDLPNAVPVDELNASFNPGELPAVESVATTGIGVIEAFVLAIKGAIRAAHTRAGKTPPSDEEMERLVAGTLEKACGEAPQPSTEEAPALFDHRFDEETYRDDWAEKGRDRQIVDQETLLAEAVQTGMELAERLDGLREVQEVNQRREKMFEAVAHIGAILCKPESPPLPTGLMQGLLSACSRARGSLLLFKQTGNSLDEREVVPPGPDPLNATVTPMGSAAFRLCQGDGSRYVEDLSKEVFFDGPPAGSPASCFIVPVVCSGIRFGAMVIYGGVEERQFEPAERAYWNAVASALGLSLHWRGLKRKLARHDHEAPQPV